MTGRRLTALDGLRGLAALVVVVHHGLLVSPAFAAAYREPRGRASGLTWVLSYTPLHLGWSGSEAVLVFFVLSGFVLALPFTGGRRSSWRSYYPKRVVRLYVPVWGAVVLATVLAVVVRRTAAPHNSLWLNDHVIPISARTVGHDAGLLLGTDYLDSPLWSLRWEVVFSLLLPVYLGVVLLARRLWPAVLIMLVAAMAVGAASHQETLPALALRYLPVFGFGVLIAVHREAIVRRLTAAGRGAAGVALLAGVLLLEIRWITPAATSRSVVLVAQVAGACVIVLAFLTRSGARRLGDRAPAQWLGLRSFSLYLIHEPIIVTVAYLTGWRSPAAIVAVTLPLSLVAAEIFYRLCEEPAHRLAIAVGARASRRRLPAARLDLAPADAGVAS